MPNAPLRGESAPVTYIDTLNGIEIHRNRAILSFDSMGANVRLTVSAETLLRMPHHIKLAIDDLCAAQEDCQVIPFRSGEAEQ